MIKKVIIADIPSETSNGKRTGHYLTVARNYKEIFGEDCKIAGGPVYKNTFKQDDIVDLPYDHVNGDSSLLLRLKMFANAKRLFNNCKGEIVVIQQSSVITTFFCILFFYHKRSSLYLILYNLEGYRLKIGRILFYLIKNKIDGIICPNKIVGEAYGLPYCVVPDYIYTKSYFDKSRLISFDKKLYDFGLLGRIAYGKGCVESAKWLARTNYKVIIAGNPQNKELEKAIIEACEGAENIKLKLGYLSDDEYNILLSQCRYSLMNYSGEYAIRSSGVVFDMVFSGTPVVGKHCIALDFVGDNKLGYLYNQIDEVNYDYIFDEKIYDLYIDNIQKYCGDHVKFKTNLISFLRR